MSLKQANKARLNKQLDKLWRDGDTLEVYKLRDRLEAGFYLSVRKDTQTMTSKEELRNGQLQYWPLAKPKVSYSLVKKDDSFIEVSKLVFDYAMSEYSLKISKDWVQKTW